MKPPLKKRTTCRVQQKFNSPKISPLPNESLPTPTPPFPQKIPPHAPPPEPNIGRLGFFRAKHGPIWVRTGLFWVRTGLFRVAFGSIFGFSGSESGRFGPRFPLPGAPPPREMCKNFTSHSPHADAPSPPRFLKVAQNSAILSQITPNLPLSVYR